MNLKNLLRADITDLRRLAGYLGIDAGNRTREQLARVIWLRIQQKQQPSLAEVLLGKKTEQSGS